MAISKVLGIEQEYAITLSGNRFLTAFDVSCMLVNSYARSIGLRSPQIGITWDYAHETPFQDIRGPLFSKKGGQIMMGAEENRLINAVLPNGARFYTDHAHPEYSTPECLSARQALAHDKAGEKVLRTAVSLLKEEFPDLSVNLFKNNTDRQGHSFGTHENYLMDADAHRRCLSRDQRKALQILIPFLVTRQIYAGAGKVGGEDDSKRPHFQISQRSDFTENLFGLETMHARPIVNTRAEHHADPQRFRRLHLIVGEANMCEFAGFLKLGATQIVLLMMEQDFIQDDLALQDPIEAIRSISRDHDTEVELEDGRRLSALSVQRYFLDHAVRFLASGCTALIPEADTIVEYWNHALDGLEQLKLSQDRDLEDDPMGLSERLDWVLKLWLLTRHRRNNNLPWHHPSLRVLDLQYHNIDCERGIYNQLERQGLTFGLLDPKEIDACVGRPPDDTRAYFRGTCLHKYPEEIFLVNWEVIGFVDGNIHRMVPLLNPLKGTRDQFAEIFARARNARELILELESR